MLVTAQSGYCSAYAALKRTLLFEWEQHQQKVVNKATKNAILYGESWQCVFAVFEIKTHLVLIGFVCLHPDLSYDRLTTIDSLWMHMFYLPLQWTSTMEYEGRHLHTA